MKPLTNRYNFVTHSSATVAGGFSVGKIFFLLCCFLIISGTTLFAQLTANETGEVAKPDSVLSEAARTEKKPDKRKVIHLFNGKNLDGWYTFVMSKGKDNDPDKVFSVADGVIRVSGTEHGCITTNEVYENYTLEVEYRVGEQSHGSRKDKAFDSGILIHSNGEDGAYGGVWMKSIEIQVIEGGTGDFFVVSPQKDEKLSLTSTVDPQFYDSQKDGGVFLPDGVETTVFTPSTPVRRLGGKPQRTDVARFRNENEIEKPHGEWNTVKIIAQNDKIDVYLNGQLVNQAKNVKPAKGHIQIQSEGAEFFYKRIDLITVYFNF